MILNGWSEIRTREKQWILICVYEITQVLHLNTKSQQPPPPPPIPPLTCLDGGKTGNTEGYKLVNVKYTCYLATACGESKTISGIQLFRACYGLWCVRHSVTLDMLHYEHDETFWDCVLGPSWVRRKSMICLQQIKMNGVIMTHLPSHPPKTFQFILKLIYSISPNLFSFFFFL